MDGFAHFGRWTGDDVVVDRHWMKLGVGARGPLNCLHRFPRIAYGQTSHAAVVAANRLLAALCWAYTAAHHMEVSRGHVNRARERVEKAGRSLSHGRIVAELSFGFWWSLLADEYNRTLWEPALCAAFAGPVRRRRLHSELDHLRVLRNRIAHHEPVYLRDLFADYAKLLDVSGRISPALRRHVQSVSRITRVLHNRPAIVARGAVAHPTSGFPVVSLGRVVTSENMEQTLDEE